MTDNTQPPDDVTPVQIVGVNAYDNEDGTVTVRMLRSDDREWTKCTVPRREAVQLADMLYLLTRERP